MKWNGQLMNSHKIMISKRLGGCNSVILPNDYCGIVVTDTENALGVMAIVIGYGHIDTSSNLGRG